MKPARVSIRALRGFYEGFYKGSIRVLRGFYEGFYKGSIWDILRGDRKDFGAEEAFNGLGFRVLGVSAKMDPDQPFRKKAKKGPAT